MAAVATQRDVYPDSTRTALVAVATAVSPVAPQPAQVAPPTPSVFAAPPFAGLASVPGFAWRHDRLVSADGRLDVAVGIYADCTGNSPIDSDRADLAPCFLGRLYFVGHSPGVFSPLVTLGPGTVVTWYDPRGNALRPRIVATRQFKRNSAPLGLSQPDVVAQFQTCLKADGSLDRILDAVRA